jgi:hypothetical protein
LNRRIFSSFGQKGALASFGAMPPTGFSDPQRMKLGAPSIALFAMGGKAKNLKSLLVLLSLRVTQVSKKGIAH